MKLLFFLGHPAHFHLFKNVILNLKNNGHIIQIVVKEKDILESLLKYEKWEYNNILAVANLTRKNNKFSILFSSGFDLIKKDWKLFKLVRYDKPDIMIGTEASISHIGKLLYISSLITNEDDTKINPEFCYLSYPFVSYIISPKPCKIGRWNYKKISYDGYQKLTYLHPKYFSPNKEIIKKFNPNFEKYFLIRFVSLTASHDAWVNKTGLTCETTKKIIDLLQPFGRIFITSERKLEPELEQYRLNINPIDIHHVLYYADIFIGDSQSMTVESAMLGTPSIRFNSFIGKISVLEELEHKYQLTYGIDVNNPEKLLSKCMELVNIKNIKQEFQNRRQKMLADKIDVTAFMVWFIENYPKSVEVMKKNPDFQYNFK